MNEKEEDILKHGIMSVHWKEYVDSLSWENESAETKLYVAGTLSGFSHDFVLRIMKEQSNLHGGNFKNMGFFVWTEFFGNLKTGNLNTEKNLVDELERLGKLKNENLISEYEFQVAKRKLLGIQ